MTGAAGAGLRPLAPHLERLRPGPAPAAGDPVDPRAGRLRRRSCDNLSQLLKDLKTSFKTDIPQDKLPAAHRAVEPDRHDQDPLVRVHARRATPARAPTAAATSDRAERQPDPRRRSRNAFKIDPKHRGSSASRSAGEDGVGLGRQRLGQGRPGDLDRGLPRVPRADRQRPDQAPGPDVQPDDDPASTTARESDLPATIALLENVFNVKATYVDRPVGHGRRRHRHDRDADPEPDRAARALTDRPDRTVRPSR